ncbi:anti-sigma F factor [Ruminococcus champanellensis]|uniref:Anti-sigma F factor n=1 Tax=Ruminococcus champanellensis (strain DSM 18848 / JCM 17042 / KCTC 15320 / 18P13) TaxID=213810 RepID=D4LET2_RUMC1|nr:anti-sigma F factor [Ruminococcus champanellensis]MED9891205.1 anti-sigma F factor [Ruminococcus champanellensis]CBL18127.1 anti-sigma F factor [Ruminococcus champanellensis 18P13 = JCM 17042]
MKTINEMKCTFPSLSVNEAYARTAVTAFAAQLDLTIEEIADIRTAVSEAVTNAIVHGYRGTVGTIELCVKLLEGNEVYIRIKDSGCGIPDVAQAMEPLYTTAAAEERAGLGFAVMESFMDKLSVKSKVGRGTTVVMRKRLGVTVPV